MNHESRFRRVMCAAFLAGVAAFPVRAQVREPHIGYVYPAGGRQGATFEVTVGGQNLDGVSALEVSVPGVRAEVLKHIKSLTRQQLNNLRNQVEKAEQLEQLGRTDPARKKEAEAIRKQIAQTLREAGFEGGLRSREFMEYRKKINDPKAAVNPAISETVVLKLTVAADAPAGDAQLRLRTDGGLTNPLRFQVGRLAEYNEREPNDRTPEKALDLPLPFVLNGQVLPGDLDRFRFKAKKGDRLVVAVSARVLIPYLADAVPGWFQATLLLRDAEGKEVAYADDNRFDPDPVIFCEIPGDGEYVLEIKDSIFRGREDFVYRIAVGDLPFITGVYPLGGPVAGSTPVELSGWNLPAARVVQKAGDGRPGVRPLSVRGADFDSNAMPFVFDTLPDGAEQEPNNAPDRAQEITLPVAINGRIERPGDVDVFRVIGRAGTEVVAEVYARRLGSPLDSALRLTDSGGRELAANDDVEDKGAGLTTHHADSRLCARLPADGTYLLHLGDTQRKGGREYAYRLRVGPPQPDFALRITPASLNVRGVPTIPVTAYALRRDGFAGEIRLGLKDAPKGFALQGATIPAGRDKVRFTLSVPPTPSETPVTLEFEGRANIGGRECVHPAVPADDMMQAFAYHHLVPADAMKVFVTDKVVTRSGAAWTYDRTPVRLPAGGTARVHLSGPNGRFIGKIELELSEPPEGITLKSATPVQDGFDVVLQSDAAKLKPGYADNLIFAAFAERKGDGGAKDKTKASPRRFPIGTLPALPVVIMSD